MFVTRNSSRPLKKCAIRFTVAFCKDDGRTVYSQLVRSDASFHLSGHVTWYNIKIWGNNISPALVGGTSFSPTFDDFCALSKQTRILFVPKAPKLNILEELLIPSLEEEDSNNMAFQQDST
jgi:hypothetical protein